MNIMYGNITLRAINMNDRDLLYMMINSPGIEATTVGSNYAVSIDSHIKWMEEFQNSDKELRFIIELKNGVSLGMISFTSIDWRNRTLEMGNKINTNERRRIYGDTLDAEYAALNYAFDELGMNRVEGRVIDYNRMSLKLSSYNGWKKEGVQRKKIFKNGRYHDLIIGAVLNEEFVRYKDGEAPWQKEEHYGRQLG